MSQLRVYGFIHKWVGTCSKKRLWALHVLIRGSEHATDSAPRCPSAHPPVLIRGHDNDPTRAVAPPDCMPRSIMIIQQRPHVQLSRRLERDKVNIMQRDEPRSRRLGGDETDIKKRPSVEGPLSPPPDHSLNVRLLDGPHSVPRLGSQDT